MNREELRNMVITLGISQGDLANLLGVTPRAISLWLAGTRQIPGPAAAYIELFASLPVGARQSEMAKRIKGSKTMKNGMYLIDFLGQAGQGNGMLILEDGRIYGADVGFGKYDGVYTYNERTDLVDMKMRVEMAAHRPSVTGIVQPFDWILEVTASADPKAESGKLTIGTNVGGTITANYRFLRPLPAAA
jgi:hypothetical protein